MTDLAARVRRFVARRRLWGPGARVVAALSGGSDSVAQLWLLHDLAAAGVLTLAGAAHLNHALRPTADLDEAFCRALCARLGVPFVGERIEVAAEASATRQSVEVAARRVRYAFLERARLACVADHIAVAHTLDDQAETVLFRFLRGSGLSGLQAMTEISPCPGAPLLKLVRPLLTIPKSRLIATLKQAGIAYADDPTNRDPRHARPRLRALMPQLEAEGLSAQRLAQLARRLRRAEDALRRAVAQAQVQISLTPWGEGTRIVLDRDAFAKLPEEIAIRLLGNAIAQVGDEGPVELRKLESLFESLSGGAADIRRSLAGALVTQAARELVIERAPPRRAKRTPGSRKHAAGRFSALTTRKTRPAGANRTR